MPSTVMESPSVPNTTPCPSWTCKWHGTTASEPQTRASRSGFAATLARNKLLQLVLTTPGASANDNYDGYYYQYSSIILRRKISASIYYIVEVRLVAADF